MLQANKRFSTLQSLEVGGPVRVSTHSSTKAGGREKGQAVALDSELATIQQEHVFPVCIGNEGAPQDSEIDVRLVRSEQPRTSARFLPKLQIDTTGSSSQR